MPTNIGYKQKRKSPEKNEHGSQGMNSFALHVTTVESETIPGGNQGEVSRPVFSSSAAIQNMPSPDMAAPEASCCVMRTTEEAN